MPPRPASTPVHARSNSRCADAVGWCDVQIPQGAIPVNNGFVLKSRQMTLGPYTTERIEYSFYFPELGTFGHYPVHVASEEALVAFAKPVVLQVVNRPSVIDNSSWQYISQQVGIAAGSCCLLLHPQPCRRLHRHRQGCLCTSPFVCLFCDGRAVGFRLMLAGNR